MYVCLFTTLVTVGCHFFEFLLSFWYVYEMRGQTSLMFKAFSCFISCSYRDVLVAFILGEFTKIN